jgi:hypothetical protein
MTIRRGHPVFCWDAGKFPNRVWGGCWDGVFDGICCRLTEKDTEARVCQTKKCNTKVTSVSAAKGRYGETTPKLASLPASEGGKDTKNAF